MFPLNGWMVAGSRPSGNGQVHRLRPGELDVGPRGVEVGVVRDGLARPGDDAEQDLLRRPALVGWNHVAERKQLLDRLRKRNHDGLPA